MVRNFFKFKLEVKRFLKREIVKINFASSCQRQLVGKCKAFSVYEDILRITAGRFIMEYKGKSHKFRDYINTDYIISGRYKFSITDLLELSKHIMEDIRPGFYKQIEKGDFIVGGKDFGGGSSREQAPLVIKIAGISAVIAKSFARIFYRNCVNLGLPPVECNTDNIDNGDRLILDLEKNKIINLNKNTELPIKIIPLLMKKFLDAGGVIEYYKQYGMLNI